MKKNYPIQLIIYFIFFVLTCVYTQTSFAQYSTDRYHPKEVIAEEGIDSCRVFVVEGDDWTLKHEIIYDEQGNEIEYASNLRGHYSLYDYNENGQLIAEYFVPFGENYYSKDSLFYNEQGQLIQRNTYGGDGKRSSTNTYKYKDDLLILSTYQVTNNAQLISEYEYEKNKMTIRKVFDDKPHGAEIHIFDKKKNLIEFQGLDAEGNVLVKHKNKYDKKNRQTELAAYDRDGQLSQVYKTTYQKNGLIKFKETYTSIVDGKLENAEYEKTIYEYIVTKP